MQHAVVCPDQLKKGDFIGDVNETEGTHESSSVLL